MSRFLRLIMQEHKSHRPTRCRPGGLLNTKRSGALATNQKALRATSHRLMLKFGSSASFPSLPLHSRGPLYFPPSSSPILPGQQFPAQEPELPSVSQQAPEAAGSLLFVFAGPQWTRSVLLGQCSLCLCCLSMRSAHLPQTRPQGSAESPTCPPRVPCAHEMLHVPKSGIPAQRPLQTGYSQGSELPA